MANDVKIYTIDQFGHCVDFDIMRHNFYTSSDVRSLP